MLEDLDTVNLSSIVAFLLFITVVLMSSLVSSRPTPPNLPLCVYITFLTIYTVVDVVFF